MAYFTLLMGLTISAPGSKKARNRGRSGDVRVPNRPRGGRRCAPRGVQWWPGGDGGHQLVIVDERAHVAVRGRGGDNVLAIIIRDPTVATMPGIRGRSGASVPRWPPAPSPRP